MEVCLNSAKFKEFCQNYGNMRSLAKNIELCHDFAKFKELCRVLPKI
jgi:hypothetical protein